MQKKFAHQTKLTLVLGILQLVVVLVKYFTQYHVKQLHSVCSYLTGSL